MFLENRSDVVMFWGFSNSTGESILNSWEAVYLGDVYASTVPSGSEDKKQ